MDETLEYCRLLYNKTLAYRRDSWEQEEISISLYDTMGLLPSWKNEFPELRSVHSQVLQNVQTRVDLAFKAFFRRVRNGETPGYPRFKAYRRYDSFTYSQSGFAIKDNKLKLSKIGNIKIVLHRAIIGSIRTCTIKKAPTGKWFVCFCCEIDNTPLPESCKQVGIDVGLNHFATLSNNGVIDNPRFFHDDEKELGKVQRKYSNDKTNCRKHAVALIHERIVNRRKDFAHKLSRYIVNQFGIIAVEDVNVSRMLHNHCLAKSISDAGWVNFLQYLSYKAEYAGRVYIAVNPAYTSQDCSNCGHRQPMPLSERTFNCPCCGLSIDRDLNAAKNILARGLTGIGINP